MASEGRRRLQCEGCGFIHYMNPRVVAAVIVEHTGRLLLQQRAIEPRRGYWTFPGGFLEVGETPEAGARRDAGRGGAGGHAATAARSLRAS